MGGANSGAQILAEVSTVADTAWVTLRPPRLLPDEIDGRALFALATRRTKGGEGVGSLGDIVAVPPVREARDRGALKTQPILDLDLVHTPPLGSPWDALQQTARHWLTQIRIEDDRT